MRPTSAAMSYALAISVFDKKPSRSAIKKCVSNSTSEPFATGQMTHIIAEMVATMSFCNVRRNRDCGAFKLRFQAVKSGFRK